MCSEEDRATMATLDDSTNYYFHLYLFVIHDLRVLIPFTLFKKEVLANTSIYSSYIKPNCWSLTKAFKIICWQMKFNSIIGMFFSSFYGTKTGTKGGWVTLNILFGRALFKPHSNHYKNWKDEFVRVKARYDASMVTTGADDALPFSQF